ncbi:MAG: hypothetical protein A2Y53_05970 [Chloroflexi bacterium RBG_16_47_49]|nr:MAG: hypothetical protein A2Y53_05970 [Chloroflexi bacterium RBG_16_47_49]
MVYQPLFKGLIFDEIDQPVDVTDVGDEPCYVVNDAGFHRHIPSEQVDRQVLMIMGKMVQGHEDQLAEQTAKMLGQDDIFSKALIENQLKNLEQQFDAVLKTGIPEEGRAYMGMMGFRVKINVHGEVLDVNQPGTVAPEDE